MPDNCKEKAVYVVGEDHNAMPYAEGKKLCHDSDEEGLLYLCYKCEKQREARKLGYELRKKRIAEYYSRHRF
jgi:hypothetical protein